MDDLRRRMQCNAMAHGRSAYNPSSAKPHPYYLQESVIPTLTDCLEISRGRSSSLKIIRTPCDDDPLLLLREVDDERPCVMLPIPRYIIL